MYSIDHLDAVLASLKVITNVPLTDKEIEEKLSFKIEMQELDAIISKIEKDGYVNTYPILTNGQKTGYEGLMFLENSLRRYKDRPYRSALIRERINRLWRVVKISAVTLNSLLVLAVAAWGVIVQQQNNAKERVSNQQPVIDTKVLIDSTNTSHRSTVEFDSAKRVLRTPQ
jgi:hypothetical protein